MNEISSFDQPVMVKIDKIIDESDGTKSFMFRHKLDYNPGQFIMIWLPGIDEKPFAVSYMSDDFFGITVLEEANLQNSYTRWDPETRLVLEDLLAMGTVSQIVLRTGKGVFV